MNKNKNSNNNFVVTSVIGFILVFVGFYTWLNNVNYSGDAAGAGIGKGYALLYGLGTLLIIAIVLTTIYLFKLKGVTKIGIKFFAFLPLGIMLVTSLFYFKPIDNLELFSDEEAIEEIYFVLTCEIKTNKPLINGSGSLSYADGKSSSKLKYPEEQGGYYVYVFRRRITKGKSIKSVSFWADNIENASVKQVIEMLKVVKPIPFTEWKSIETIPVDSLTEIAVEVRYKVEK